VHEGSVTTQIVEKVLTEAKSRNAKKVLEVVLEIGKLTFLNPEQVRFWYKILVQNTILEESKLIIEESEGLVKCPKCNYEGGFQYVDDPIFHLPMPTLNCPKCNNVVEIIGGKNCIIKNVKMLI